MYPCLAAKLLRRGGYAIFATFAPDGPERSGGLALQRKRQDRLRVSEGALRGEEDAQRRVMARARDRLTLGATVGTMGGDAGTYHAGAVRPGAGLANR